MTTPAQLARYPFLRAVQPLTGIVTETRLQAPMSATPELFLGITALGNIAHLDPAAAPYATQFARGELVGCGASLDEEHARAVAVAEALERYCNAMVAPGDAIVASADELGDEATDWRDFPALSARELADPACPLRPFDPAAKMRWIRGWSLTRNRPAYVPLAMTHLYLTLSAAENFTFQISTGVAAHGDVQRACVSAICEVIERDAIALTWLGKLPLTRLIIEGDGPLEAAAELAAARRRAAIYTFFDATTDLGIPTTLCLQTVAGHPTMHQVVSCSTNFSAGLTVAKAIREAVAVSTVFDPPAAIPGEPADFTNLLHGSSYMARPVQRAHFDFLLESPRAVTFERRYSDPLPAEPAAQLVHLRELFRRKRMDVVLVDMTVDEVRRHGLSVVRAVIPALMPITFVHRARFLGHRRLYDYARSIGHALTEASVNPAPMPFA